MTVRKQTVTERNPNGKRKSGVATRRTSRGKPRARSALRNPHAGRKADVPRLIVGIGASAGGLEAFKTFFANMPADTGMAFVLVQHLDPHHKSMLVDLLGRHTEMKVVEARDGVPVVANRVFIIPPDATLTITDGALRVTKPAPPREHRRPIDTFFASLAEDQGEHAVCIVLSGTGSDGTLGLRKIKEHGGLTLAQAEFDPTAMSGMPQSAAATGLVDHIMPVEEMPALLMEYQRICSKSLRKRTTTAPAATRLSTWRRSAPCCAPAPAMTSGSTSRTPWCGGSSAGCRCCASTRCPPSLNVCARSRGRSSCCFANS